MAAVVRAKSRSLVVRSGFGLSALECELGCRFTSPRPVGDRVGHDRNSFPFWVHGCGRARRESRGSRGGDVVLREYRSEAAARAALTPCRSVQSWKVPNA
jgi:hypothetical protein